MAKKKSQATEAAVAEGEVPGPAPPDVSAVEKEPVAVSLASAGGNGARCPLVSYQLCSDRTTSIELAVWGNTYKNQQGEEYEQLSVTVQRSYRDQNQQWCKGGSWRVHDIPCLMFLLQKVHSFALDRRTSDSSIPF